MTGSTGGGSSDDGGGKPTPAPAPTFSGRKVHQSALALIPEEGSALHAAIQSIRREHDKQVGRDLGVAS